MWLKNQCERQGWHFRRRSLMDYQEKKQGEVVNQQIKIVELAQEGREAHGITLLNLIFIITTVKATFLEYFTLNLHRNSPQSNQNHPPFPRDMANSRCQFSYSRLLKYTCLYFCWGLQYFPSEYRKMMPYQYYQSNVHAYYPFLDYPIQQHYGPCPSHYFQLPQFQHPHFQHLLPKIEQQSNKVQVKMAPEGKDNPLQVSAACDSAQTAVCQQRVIQWNKDEVRMKNQNQIAARNANSNLLRIFFRQLEQQLGHDQTMITRIIAKGKMKTTCGRFLEWLEINRVEHKNYIRLPCVKKMFIGRKGKQEHPKIMRILLKHFLQKDVMCSYLTSKKIKKTMMRFNYQSMRNIFLELKTTNSA